MNTRKFGAFHTINLYEDHIFQSLSTITFDVKKFKIPLKFVGREQRISSYSDQKKDENVRGKIILLYKYF